MLCTSTNKTIKVYQKTPIDLHRLIIRQSCKQYFSGYLLELHFISLFPHKTLIKTLDLSPSSTCYMYIPIKPSRSSSVWHISKDTHWSASSYCKADNDLLLILLMTCEPEYTVSDPWILMGDSNNVSKKTQQCVDKKYPRGVGDAVRGLDLLGKGWKEKKKRYLLSLEYMIHWEMDVGLLGFKNVAK